MRKIALSGLLAAALSACSTLPAVDAGSSAYPLVVAPQRPLAVLSLTDARLAQSAAENAVLLGPLGVDFWANPESGAFGMTSVVGRDANNCMSYSQDTWADGKHFVGVGSFCAD